jgi:ribonuclease I
MSKGLIITLITLLTLTLAQKKDNFGLEVNSYILSLHYKPYHCGKATNSTTFCSNGDKSRWVINGLFPNNKESGPVTFCSTRGFTIDKLKQKTREQLTRFWANYNSNSNIESYKLSWEKHGSCVDFKKLNVKLDREEFYFNKAVQLRHTYNLDFLSKNISLRDLNTQIGMKFNGRKIHVTCTKDPNNDKLQIIEEIKLLFDTNFVLVDYLKQDSCQQSVKIRVDEEKKETGKKDEM